MQEINSNRVERGRWNSGMTYLRTFLIFLIVCTTTMWLLLVAENTATRWKQVSSWQGGPTNVTHYLQRTESGRYADRNRVKTAANVSTTGAPEEDNSTRLMMNKTNFFDKVLENSIVKADAEVMKMDINKIIRTIDAVRFKENRLLYKLQRWAGDSNSKCVISILKYCTRSSKIRNKSASPDGWEYFRCPFTNCMVRTRYVTKFSEMYLLRQSDIVIIFPSLHEQLRLNDLMRTRPDGQLWVLFSRESPQHDTEYAPLPGTLNPYNLSFTYSPDADIYSPYFHFQKTEVDITTPVEVVNKTKLMMWMASNCHLLSWNRGKFVEELQKHLPVDTYGRCGQLDCPKGEENMKRVIQQYKFYLSLENSECNHYITEKFSRNGLHYGAVPVVYGAPREDYVRIAPPNSFIHLEDFDSMSDFVNFIKLLDQDEKRYQKYFEWKTKGTVVVYSGRSFMVSNPDINFCYLTRVLVHRSLHPDVSWHKKTPDFAKWWKNRCHPKHIRKQLLGVNIHDGI